MARHWPTVGSGQKHAQQEGSCLVIGFLADKIPYEMRRGWGVYAYQLLKAMLEIDRENTYHCFYNIFHRGKPDCVLKSNSPNLSNFIWRIPGRIMDLLWEDWSLLPAERFLGKIDVLHVPYEFLPKMESARTVVTVHDVTFLSHPEYLDPGFVKLYSRRIHRVVEKADRIITDSENTRKELMQYTGVPRERVTTIPCGISECFRPVDDTQKVADVCRRHGVLRPYILFVGAADEDKNLVRLAKAFARVRAKHTDLQLVFAGKIEWGFDRLMGQLRQLGIGEGITLTGFVPDQDLPILYSGAELLAMPSLHEGFGLPALEAMACGIPVLCSNIASLPEVVGDAGLQVDPYNVDEIAQALETLLTDGNLRATCISKGLARSREHTWTAAAARVLGVYREIMR